MSVRILITGGAGFLGSMLASRLLDAGMVSLDGGPPMRIEEVMIADLVAPHHSIAQDPRVRALEGELSATIPDLGDVDVICHLAGVVSGAAEADFDLGMRTNVDGLREMLEYGRARRTAPMFLFTSSIAVFGNDPAVGPVADVNDETLPRPQSSYGVQKFIGEQLVADYTRRGFVRGRSVRLMTVSVRPGSPNAAASSFLSSIIREPLAGIRTTCPVPPSTRVAISSPRRTVDGILRALEVNTTDWGSRTALNLPALTTTPREMVQSLDRVAGDGISRLIDWEIDPSVLRIVGSWPYSFSSDRAESLGLRADESFDAVVRDYLEHVQR